MSKKLILSLLLLLILLPETVFALRCGSRLVSEGDHYTRVLQLCGKPEYVSQWEETRIYRGYDDPLDDYYNHGRLEPGKTYGPKIVKRPIFIEEWTYNFGRSRLMRLLRFENGRLQKIQTLDYGY